MNEQIDAAMIENSRRIFQQQRQQIFRRTDRMFAALMVLQWIGGIVAACILTPWTWNGAERAVHPHVWFAVFFGGALASLPVALAWRFPGRLVTRHVIAVTQMLFSSLFIHISGGRIETHFHVFGSLAFLAFYRDWPLLIPATVIVAADHFVRGIFWPETVFGSSVVSPWRWMEHAAWVAFEDVFLIIACCQGVKDLWTDAVRTAELERMNTESRERTVELENAYRAKHAVVETALDAVISMDEEGRVIGWNSQATKTFGWPADEAFGRRLSDVIIPARFCSLHEQGIRHYRETGASKLLNSRIETTAVHRDGHEFPVELAIAPIRGGEKATFCAFVRDITERTEAADRLQRAKEAAEAANRAKSAFLAHMSHEIRTPLNGVLGFTDLLLKMGPQATQDERHDYLERINHSGRHLLGLINDVLDLSKVESGQIEVELVPCAPHAIIADTISILRVRAQEKGINLEYKWTSRIPETIVTDPSRFRQLLMNLIGNAIKFTERGRVEVAARIEENAGAHRLSVDVTDTGIGIAPDNLERIFEPFAQADQSITRRFGGTGLGLSISRQFADLLGGKLTVDSELGRGSRFTATIDVGSLAGVRLLDTPVADLIPRAGTKAAAARPALSSGSILLVDDGVDNRKLISLMLQRAGLEVTTAENGQVGLDLALRQKFDLILMDMQMPILDGYMATRELRRRGETIPVIALTAHSMKGDEEQCREAGCTGYLTKPIDSDRLLAAIAVVLRERPQPSLAGQAFDGPTGRLTSDLPMEDPEFRDAVEQFVDRLQEKLDVMHRCAAGRDFSELARMAHWLKGSAGTAGFRPLTSPAALLEQAAKEGDPGAVDESLARVRELVAQIDRPGRTSTAVVAQHPSLSLS